eukprot:2734830-Rhodomonas_salina.1
MASSLMVLIGTGPGRACKAKGLPLNGLIDDECADRPPTSRLSWRSRRGSRRLRQWRQHRIR